MESTIEKLNQNRLMELTKEDYENIANNTELKTLFLFKVKEGHEFDTNEAYFLEEALFTAEYITIFLDLIKKQQLDNYIDFFFISKAEIRKQLDEKTADILLKYIEDNTPFVLEKLPEIEEIYNKIENQTIINHIISNKMEKYYGSIYMETPTEEFEELLLDALNRNEYKRIYTLSLRIINKCLETGNLKATLYGVRPENKEESEIVFTALEEESITYNDLPYDFLKYHEKNPRLIKYNVRNNQYISINEEELQNEEIRRITIEEIERNHEIANNIGIYISCENHLDVALSVIKYCNKKTLISIINHSGNMVRNLLENSKEEFIDTLIYNLEHNQSAIEEIIKELYKKENYYHPEITLQIIENKKFFDYYISKISLETILPYLISYDYDRNPRNYIKPEIYELLSTANITFTTIPENINYNIDYPENVWLALIPLLNSEQLKPNNISLKRFINNEKIFDCILLRLKELKSNSYNSYLYDMPITQTFIDIICDHSNPLNLNTTQKLQILPASKMTSTKHLLEIIKQSPKLEYMDIQVLIPKLISMENTEETKKIYPIIFSKMDKSFRTIDYITTYVSQISKHLSNLSSYINNDIDNNQQQSAIRQEKIFYDCLQEFLKTEKNIPLSLTQYFDIEIIKAATYSNTEALVSNPELFNSNGYIPEHFTNFIKECQSKNLPIDLKIIYNVAISSANESLFDYPHITFTNDEDTYKLLSVLINTSIPDSPKRKIVDNWVNKELSYKFFDCQIEANKTQLINLLVSQSEYIDKILEIINSNNIQDNIVLSSKLNKMLITTQNNPEKHEKVLNIIIKLIEQRRINNFSADNDLETYINLINHPTFIKYVIDTNIIYIGNNPHNIRIFLSSPKYKQATLDALTKNPYTATNQYVLQLTKEYKEIKEFVKNFLEQSEDTYLEFNENYLDTDLLTAYLKHHSIDKVITFIVHNQNLSLITPDLYNIIKTKLLEKHPEYNKETFNILEKFYNLELLLLLETENFIKLLQKEPELAQKLIEVLKERKLDESIITSINDSFRQNFFNIENAHIINFYTNTLEKIQRGITEEEITEIISILINYIPSKLEKDIEATENQLLLNTYKTNKQEFLKILIQELGKNQNIYAPLFNKITNNLIVQKRNEYRSSQDIYKDTNLKYELETKSLYNALFNYLIKNKPIEIYNLLNTTENRTSLNLKTITLLSGVENNITKEELPEIKRNIPKLKEIVFNVFNYMNENDKESEKNYYWHRTTPKRFENLPKKYEYLLDNLEFMKQVKKIPIYPRRKKPIVMFSNINLDVFELLSKDEEKLKSLISLLNKYRFLEWENLFSPTVSKLSLGEDGNDIFNFINAFNKIYDNEKRIILRERKKLIETIVKEMKKEGKSPEEIDAYIRVKNAEPININITAYKILKYSTIYSSIANYYKIILGMEDFELVKRNDGPNSSYRNAEERLQRASEMQIKMMELNEITIPSFIYDHEISTEENHKLRVTVGNRANSRNLTHGERTGACMRAYGHADSLFEFCNTDPRGFHIVFTDPKTDEYVSRVSGFRNGNTVFLNQLRNSISSKYSNDDVISACKAVAAELIERSKDSAMPIENVVASPYYALQNYQTQQLSDFNIGNGVYTGYKDVSGNAVVLATTGENGLAVPLKLDGENQPIYEAVRLQPKEYTSEQITDDIRISIQRITALKDCLNNKDNPEYYKTIDFDYELIDTKFIHVIIGQDWYVALDINGNITYDIAVQNIHSIEELNEAIAKINTIKESKMKIGGLTNGI